MKAYRFSAVVEKDHDGYFAFCPEIQGCYTQGATHEEALQNLKDAIRLHVQDRIQAGEEIPQPESISLTRWKWRCDREAPTNHCSGGNTGA